MWGSVMERVPVSVESIEFDALFYRPHRRMFNESMAEGEHFLPNIEMLTQIVLKQHAWGPDPITNIQVFEYGNDSRLPLSPKTWIVTGTWLEFDGSPTNGALGFISQGVVKNIIEQPIVLGVVNDRRTNKSTDGTSQTLQE